METISDDDLIPPTSPTTIGPNTNFSSPAHSPSSLNNDLSSDDEENAIAKENRVNPLQNATASFTQFRGAVLGDRGLFEEIDGDEKKNMIWGTTVNTDQVNRDFREFINSFPDPNNPDGKESLYLKILDQMIITEDSSLNLNAEYVWSYNETLYKQLINYPSEIIPIMDTAINQIFLERYHLAKYGNLDNLNNPEFSSLDRIPIQVRPFNLRTVKPMRDLDPEDIDKLITVRGMITRVSPIIPDLKQAYYECVTCKNSELVLPDKDGTFTEPKQCANCKGKQTISLIHNKSFFSDKQWIKLQETPDAIPEGETPHTVSIYAYDMLVDVAKPGDRIEITGIYRATAVRNSNTQRVLRSIYKTYIDVIHFKKSEKYRMKAEDAKANSNSEFYTQFNEGDAELVDSFVKEKEDKLKKLSEAPDIYEKLTRSLAPSVWELDDVKKGILCQLFGGTNKQFSDSGLGRCRGEINVLLCGDPGTSKSQLLQYVHKIAPRGIYTSGKGSSAVGLTAYITRDPESREAVLESGALVLSDRGICCIDEFDKMGDATRSILHEAMEQQTVSIAKAGIICTLNARTSILASANPRESKYNPRLSVVDNIQLPPTLLSRFDLIYLVLDKPEENSDRRLASHLVSLYTKDPNLKQQDYLDMATFTDYITYAKQFVHPKISDECVEDIVRGYLDMRKLGTSKKTITATPRQLESIIRIAEAHARMRYSQFVERIDVAEAIRLLRSATQQAAIDPKTGTIDMDLITTGRSATSRSRLAELVKELRNLLTTQNSSWRFDQLLKQMMDQSSIEITTTELREALKQLEEVEFIALGGSDRNPTITVL